MDSAKDWVKNNYPDLLDTEKTEVSYQLAAIELLLDNLRDDLKVHAIEDYIQRDARRKKMKGKNPQETIWFHLNRNLKGYKP